MIQSIPQKELGDHPAEPKETQTVELNELLKREDTPTRHSLNHLDSIASASTIDTPTLELGSQQGAAVPPFNAFK